VKKFYSSTFIVLLILSSLSLVVSSTSSANTNFGGMAPGPPWSPVVKTAAFNKVCLGATHDPHYSVHVPGTINVIASTTCAGRQVSVETDLYQGSLPMKITFLTRAFVSRKSIAELSTSWKCQLGHTYVITSISYHADDRFHTAETLNRATVYCGKIVIRPSAKPNSKK
jgi:hypothetical protein